MSQTAPLGDRGETAAGLRLTGRARPLRRGAGTVQFGLDPSHGVVLTGLTEAEVAWLFTLASLPGRRASLSPRRAERGLDPQRVAHLVMLLRAHGLVREGDHGGAGRTRTRVAVLGEGPLAARLRAQVRLGGVTHVDTTVGADPPHLVVLVAQEALVSREARAWGVSGTDHLPVLVGDGWARVGPLVGGPGTPCLRCLDLTCSDQDPAWPILVDQIVGSRHTVAPVVADPALSSTVCGVVGMLLRARLNGMPVPTGVSWSVRLPSPQLLARRWAVHPRCDMPHRVAEAAVAPAAS